MHKYFKKMLPDAFNNFSHQKLSYFQNFAKLN